MTPLYYLLGVLIFVVAILASIGLHECGHMIPAKKFGGKVTQYFIGFGPTVWSKQVGETEYGVKAIPLGGYVKIVGMLPPGAAELADPVGLDADGNPIHRVRKSNTGLFTQLISDARAAEWELVKPGDTDRLFYKMPWWKKVIVMSGGPTVNIAIAFGIFAFVFATYGNLGDRPVEPVVSAVSECAIYSTDSGRDCTPADPPAPANAMGFELGDRIVAFNGVEVSTWPEVQKLIRSNDNGQAVIDVLRDGERVTLTGNTRVVPRPTSETDETPIPTGFLGISPTIGDPVTGGLLYTVEQMGHMTVDTVQALAQLPVKVWGVAQALVGIQERDPEGPMSIVGGGRIAGETAAGDLPGQGEGDLPAHADRGLQLLHRHVQLRPAAAPRRWSHRRGPVGGPAAGNRPHLPATRSRVRRRGQAPADRLRDGGCLRGHGRRADRRRPLHPDPPDLLTVGPAPGDWAVSARWSSLSRPQLDCET